MIEPTRLAAPSDDKTDFPLPPPQDSEEEGRLEVGQLFDRRYRIEAMVGRGGMGEVYQARDLRLHQTIALKLLHESASRDAQALSLFIEEVRIARQITHPNVCRVFDLGEVDGTYFLTMESIDGDDLASVLKWAGPVPQQRAAALALQICQGLDAVHQQGILHRDLKPSNLLFDLDGLIHLTDFGLAGWVENDASQGGTPRYMAPELFAGEPASLQSDLYALGVTLYELLTGEHPYAGQPLGAIKGKPIRPSRYAAVDPSFERAILRCLDGDPERRPSSVEALINSLTPGIEGNHLRTILHGQIESAHLESHDRVLQDLLDQHGGLEVEHGSQFLLLFERPYSAARFALAYQTAMVRRLVNEQGDSQLEAPRIGIHLGEVSVHRNRSPTEGGHYLLEAEGPAVALVRQLAQLAAPKQILLTHAAASLARRGHGLDTFEDHGKPMWMSHGDYRLQGSETHVEVFEVGRPGFSPLNQPESSPHGVRIERNETILGWRPAPGLDIPRRSGWRLQRRVGEGGFGEVWLAQHHDGKQRRIFKFCYDQKRLHALKREIALVQHVNDTLGERDDIAKILDWNLDEAPFFLETEYTAGGNLAEWAERQGGLGTIPIEQRRDLIAQIAEALSASHSVGVLHKDVKPENILITGNPGEPPKIRLTDFGVGVVIDGDDSVEQRLTELRPPSVTEMVSPLSAATRLYASPEILEGKNPSAQADVYALGVLLYQMEVGDFSRALATGWEHDIEDRLVRQDIAAAVDGSPERRLASPRLLADRLRDLPRRHAKEHQLQLDAQAMRRSRRFQRWSGALTILGFTMAALLWVHQSRLAKAKARAELEAATAEQVSQFLVELFETADPSVAMGEDITARQLLDRGAERLDTELEGQGAIRARLALVMGSSYYALGLYGPAQELLQRALDEHREVLGDSIQVADSLVALSDVHLDLGQYEIAEQLSREAVEILQDPSLQKGEGYGVALRQLGNALLAQGDEAEAGDYYLASYEALHRVFGEEHIRVAYTLDSLGVWYQRMGRHPEGEQALRRALAICTRLQHAQARTCAVILNNLAGLLSDMGQDEEAEPLLLQALQLHRKYVGNVHRDVAFTLNNLALILERGDRLDEAEAMHREALDIKKQLYGETHPSVAISYGNLALLMHARQQYRDAMPYFRRALDIAQADGTNNRHPLGIFSSNQARTQLAMGDDDAAGVSLDKALAALGDHYDADHWRMAQVDSLRGEWLLRSGRLDDAEPLLRRAVPILEQQKGEDSWYALEAAARLEALEAMKTASEKAPESRATSPPTD